MSDARRSHPCNNGCAMERKSRWDDINECFLAVRGIKPTDIDGFVEMSGHFLLLEEKQEGEPLSKGQEAALKRIAQMRNVTVIYFRPGEARRIRGSHDTGWRPMSRDGLLCALRQWVAEAEHMALAAP